jgi:hypothetical protein
MSFLVFVVCGFSVLRVDLLASVLGFQSIICHAATVQEGVGKY